jgi:hypothetical protein
MVRTTKGRRRRLGNRKDAIGAGQDGVNSPRASGANRSALDRLQSQVDGGAEYGLFPAIDLELVSDAPITILVSPRLRENRADLSAALGFIASKSLQKRIGGTEVLFRAVEITKLGQVIRTGCDVVPSNAPLFASDYASKAWEYGGTNKVVMVFERARLQETFKKVRSSEAPEILRRIRSEYPSAKEIDRDWLWFSRLPLGDGRIATVYETDYSFFIPGNPQEALLMVFLVGTDRDRLRTEFLKQTETLALKP